MGFFDEIKKITRPYDEFDDEFEEDAEFDTPSRSEARSNPFSQSYSAPEPAPVQRAAPPPRQAARRDGKVVNFSTASGAKVVLLKPERYETGRDIADHLRSMHTIVINIETTPKDVARRLLDFLSGAAYALDGRVDKVSNNTFIITPSTIDLAGDLISELETGDFSF